MNEYVDYGIIGDLLMHPGKPPGRLTRCVCPAVNVPDAPLEVTRRVNIRRTGPYTDRQNMYIVHGA